MYLQSLVIAFFAFVNNASAEVYTINELVRMTNDVTNDKSAMLFATRDQTLEQKGVVRFNTSREIPLYFIQKSDEKVPAKIVGAVDQVEQLVGNIFSDFRKLRYDTTSKFDEASFRQKTGVSGGLVVSVGTAYHEPNDTNAFQTHCANVGVGPNDSNLFFGVDPETGLYQANTILWINVGHAQCKWNEDMIVHEFAHALGMFKHIDCVFSDGNQSEKSCSAPSWSPKAEEILRAIYRNPANTPYSSLQ